MKVLSIALLLAAFSPSLAFAFGGDSSGGGRGVVCRDSHDRIKSAELLDVWEAKTLFRRKITLSKDSVDVQVARALGNLSNAFYFDATSATTAPSSQLLMSSLQPYTDLFEKPSANVVRLHKTKLTDTPDSDEPAVPESCHIEQIVNFMDSPTKPLVLINQDIVDRLSKTDQAALIVHEALYGFLRQYGEKNSIRARRAVGYVFAGGTFPSQDQFLRAPHIDCMSTEGALSVVSLVTKPDGSLGIVQRLDQGLLMVGVFDAPAESDASLSRDFENSLAFVLSDQSCKHLPTGDTP